MWRKNYLNGFLHNVTWDTLWSKYFFTQARTGWLTEEKGTCTYRSYFCILSGIHIITGRWQRRRTCKGNGTKHIKYTINHQLQKFTLLRLVYWLTVIFCTLRGGKTTGDYPVVLLGLFLLIRCSGWSNFLKYSQALVTNHLGASEKWLQLNTTGWWEQ